MRLKKIMALMLSMTMLALTACGGGATTATTAATTADSGSSSNETQAPTGEIPAMEKITMINNYTGSEPPPIDHEAVRQMKEHSGTQLDITWVPSNGYDEKVNALIASRSLPMITMTKAPRNTSIVSAARSGMFWDLAPYIGQFENLSSIDQTIYDNLAIDGGYYLIPRTRYVTRFGGTIRKDWLDNLGLEMPTNMEELTEIIRAFTEDDPDQNGQNDTYGLTLMDSSITNRFGTLISVYEGGLNKWGVDENDQIISEFITEEHTNTLKWFRELYEHGRVNKDFAVNKDELANFMNGSAGVLFLGNLEDVRTHMDNLTEVFPEAEIGIFQILEGADGGKRLPAGPGYNGALLISKTAVETEEELLGVLSFLDKLGDDEMLDLINWGAEGECYTVDGGLVSRTPEQMLAFNEKYSSFRQITPFFAFENLQAKDMPEIQKEMYELMDASLEFVVADYSLPFISETNIEMGNDLISFMNDSRVKFVVGELSEEEYMAAVQRWLDMGGQKMTDEYNEQYQASK
jgi:ABC-type sugar transport system, periplasmic component